MNNFKPNGLVNNQIMNSTSQNDQSEIYQQISEISKVQRDETYDASRQTIVDTFNGSIASVSDEYLLSQNYKKSDPVSHLRNDIHESRLDTIDDAVLVIGAHNSANMALENQGDNISSCSTCTSFKAKIENCAPQLQTQNQYPSSQTDFISVASEQILSTSLHNSSGFNTKRESSSMIKKVETIEQNEFSIQRGEPISGNISNFSTQTSNPEEDQNYMEELQLLEELEEDFEEIEKKISHSTQFSIEQLRASPNNSISIDKNGEIIESGFESLQTNIKTNQILLTLLKKNISSSNDEIRTNFTHLLLYGPPGCGKSRRSYAILDTLYGSSEWRESLTESYFTQTIKDRDIRTRVLQSKYHLEINLNDIGHYYDHYFITSIILHLTKLPSIYGKKPGTDILLPKFRICIVNGIEELSHSAQSALRRVMEKHTNVCKLILIARSTNGVIDAIKSRCLSIRIPSPNDDEIRQVISQCSQQKNINVPENIYDIMIKKSNGNLRKAYSMVDIYQQLLHRYSPRHWKNNSTFNEMESISPNFELDLIEKDFCLDWELEIDKVSNLAIKNQTITTLITVRQQLYKLLSNGISPYSILRRLIENFSKAAVDQNHLIEIQNTGATTEYLMKKSHRPIFHIEAFLSKFMRDLKSSLESEYGDLNELEELDM